MSSTPTKERASSNLQLQNQEKRKRYTTSDDMDLTDNLNGDVAAISGFAAISGSTATTRLAIENGPTNNKDGRVPIAENPIKNGPTNIENGTPIAETVFDVGRSVLDGSLCDGYSSVFVVGRSVLDGKSRSSGGAASSGEAADGGGAAVEVVRQVHVDTSGVTLALSLVL